MFRSIYQGAKRVLSRGREADTLTAFTAGCLAGFGFWAACFPVDTIKTQYQGFKGQGTPQVTELVSNLYRTQGVRGFYHGITPCLLRSVPVHRLNLI